MQAERRPKVAVVAILAKAGRRDERMNSAGLEAEKQRIVEVGKPQTAELLLRGSTPLPVCAALLGVFVMTHGCDQ